MSRLIDAVGVLVQARSVRRLLVVFSLFVAVAAVGLGGAPQAEAGVRWAAAPVATIHPGVMTFTPVGQCTANFVFFQGSDVFIGQAAHCAGTGSDTDTDGCSSASLPLGTKVDVDGATKQGTMVYSSWLAMQKAHEQDPATCAFNDFALVSLDPADYSRVNPTIPHWGGPTGVSHGGLPGFARTYSVGNSELRGGLGLLQPKVGFSLGDDDSGWSHSTYQILPGIPGDSGLGPPRRERQCRGDPVDDRVRAPAGLEPVRRRLQDLAVRAPPRLPQAPPGPGHGGLQRTPAAARVACARRGAPSWPSAFGGSPSAQDRRSRILRSEGAAPHTPGPALPVRV